MKYQIALVLFGLACAVFANPTAKVEPKIWQDFEESDTINVLVTFKKSNTKAALDRFYSLRLTSRDAILNTQYSILKDHADVVQADVTTLLRKLAAAGKKHEITQLWINNELVVRNVDRETVETLRDHPDVESLVAEQFIQLDPFEEEGFSVLDDNTVQNQWHIVTIRAPEVWANGNLGAGITVGVVDTGARHTHQLLTARYRGHHPGENHNYNFFAPTGQAAVPADTNGHGTHVTGTISGTGGIGVAPESSWIACRGCATAACSNFDLLGCGQWIACPTDTSNNNPQCGRAPHVVNNSWGGGSNNPWYDDTITAWRNAGIVPVFAAGNSGPNCNTVISPGDRPGAIGVASTTNTNVISNFSSVGPAAGGAQKPDIAAPGSAVVSASHLTDTGLSTLSGTSMASPHVAGAFALVLSARPNLTIDQALAELQAGSVAHVSQARVCSGVSEVDRPNYHVGAGLIDVYNSA